LEKVETAETNPIESKLSQQIYRQTDRQTDRTDIDRNLIKEVSYYLEDILQTFLSTKENR
jgi:hypothetical protein